MTAQVFVSGTWRVDKARAFRDEALLAGRMLAEAGLDMACGPGTGIARYVIDGYRSVRQRGQVRYYLPRTEDMRRVGEEVEPGADVIEQTEFDYPMRNVYQIGQSAGLLVLTGGDGTLEEILPAVIDYSLPVAIREGSGTAGQAARLLLQVYPEWAEHLIFGQDIEALVSSLIVRVESREAHRQAEPRSPDV